MSLFYNCFLRLFGDGPISSGDTPGGGTFAGGGGGDTGDGGGGGCQDCPPPDPCDEPVQLRRCSPVQAGCGGADASGATRGELVDLGCIPDCNTPLLCNTGLQCDGWFELVEPDSTCDACCPEPPPIECDYYYCANNNCGDPAETGGCCELSTISFPLSQHTSCPTGRQGPFDINGVPTFFYQGQGGCVNREQCFGYATVGSDGAEEDEFCDVWKCEPNANCTSFIAGISKLQNNGVPVTSCDFGTAEYTRQGITVFSDQATCDSTCNPTTINCWKCNGCAGDRGNCEEQAVTHSFGPNATCEEVGNQYYSNQSDCQTADNDCCIEIPGMDIDDGNYVDFDPSVLANEFMQVYPCLSAYVEEVAGFVYRFKLHPVGCFDLGQGQNCDPLAVCPYDTQTGQYNPLIIEPTSFQAYQSKLGNLSIEGDDNFYIDSQGRIIWTNAVSLFTVAAALPFQDKISNEFVIKRKCCDNFSLFGDLTIFCEDTFNTADPDATVALEICESPECDCTQDCFADYTGDHPCAGTCAGGSEPLPPINDDTGASTQAEAEYLNSLRQPTSQDPLFDPLANGRVYKTRLKNVYVRNDIRTDIFSNRIHVSLSYILKSYETSTAPIETAFDDITTYNIEKSLNEEALNAITSLQDFNRKSLKYPILNRLKYLIISNNLDNFNLGDIEALGGLLETRASTSKNNLNAERSALELIDAKSKPLNRESYTGEGVEAMRLWKTLAPDVNKRIDIVTSSGTIEEHPVDINDQFELQLSDGTLSKYSIQDGDIFKYINSTGDDAYLDLGSDIDQALALDPLDAAEIFRKLNQNLTLTLDASSDPDNKIEQVADLSTARDDYYVFKLETSTIADGERALDVIRVTTAEFTQLTSDRDITEWASTKPWPYNVFFIDQEDSILDHMLDSGNVKITFKDISFDKFIGYEADYPLIPRRMPWYVVIVPTDRSNYILDALPSKLIAYNKRRLTLSVIPDTNLHGTISDSPIFEKKIADLGQGVDPRIVNEFGPYKMEYVSTKVQKKYKPYKDEQKPVRKASPVRNLFNTLETLQTDGSSFVDLDDTTVSWGSVYQNLNVYDKKTLQNYSTTDWDAIKPKLVEKTFYDSETIKALFPKISSVPPTGITNIDDFEVKKQIKATKRVDIDPDDTPPDGPILIP